MDPKTYFTHTVDSKQTVLNSTVYTSEYLKNYGENYQFSTNIIARSINDLYLSLPEKILKEMPEQRSQTSKSYELTYGITEVPALAVTEVHRNRKAKPTIETMTTPLQVWEGKVQFVDDEFNAIDVILSDKSGRLPDHSARISLEWITDQDHDLVKPGAIFYLILYKEKKRGSLKNSQELRFRRLPNWSRSQLTKITQESERLLSMFIKK